MYCFFSIRSLYTTFENVSIFKELISIYYWMLSLFSCTTKPKEPYLLTINKTPISSLINAVKNLDKEFRIPKRRLRQLIPMIHENDKKIALHNHFLLNLEK